MGEEKHKGSCRIEPLVPTFPEWVLQACDKCLQMTNHENGKCLKCRAKEIRKADKKEQT